VLLAIIRYSTHFENKSDIGRVHGWTAAPSSPGVQLNRAEIIVSLSEDAVPGGVAPRRDRPPNAVARAAESPADLRSERNQPKRWADRRAFHSLRSLAARLVNPRCSATRTAPSLMANFEAVALIEMLSKVIDCSTSR
jgi:hypothetical protein